MKKNIRMSLCTLIYLAGFIFINGCLSDTNADSNTKTQNTKDTCKYTLKLPADLDIPSTPHFDTTIYRSKECRIHILQLPSWGTETSYTITSKEGKERSAHFFAGKKGIIDITDLPAGIYSGYLMACGNGGGFTIEIK